MRIVSPPSPRTTIYDRDINSVIGSGAGTYPDTSSGDLWFHSVPSGRRYIVNSVALRLSRQSGVGVHKNVLLTVCVNGYASNLHLAGITLFGTDNVIERYISVQPNIVLTEGTDLSVCLAIETGQDPVNLSYYLAVSEIDA